MLTLRVARNDLDSAWRSDGAGWTHGKSEIRPFRHPALVETSTFDDDGLRLAIGNELELGAEHDDVDRHATLRQDFPAAALRTG